MKTASRFDEAASQWDSNPTRVALARAVGERIIETVKPQPHWRALDYGAGTGLVTLSLQPHLGSIVAVDLSSGMLEVLAQKLAAISISNVSICQWDLQKEAFPEGDFDLVFSSMTLHHIQNVPLLIRRFFNVLKPGAKIALADLDKEDGSFHGPSNDVFHHGFERPQIHQWLSEAGFEQITLQTSHQLTKPSSTGEIRTYSVFLACATRK